MEQLYTVKEVSKIFKITVQAIYKWKNEGKINFVYFNGKPRIKESELKRLMKGE